MKIYIAGKLSQREVFHDYRKKLWLLGYEVTSNWIDEITNGTGAEHAEQIAIRDLAWIAESDIVLLDTTEEISTKGGGGGREFEFGFACGKKLLWRVGPKRSAFHSLATRSWRTWEELFWSLESIQLAEGDWK